MSWLIFSLIVVVSAFFGDTSIYQGKQVGKCLPYTFRIILTVTLSFLIGFGGQISSDHFSYECFYLSDNVASFSFSDTFGFGTKIGWSEPGFVALSKVIWLLGFDVAGYFFIIALITNAFMVNVYYRFRAPVLIFIIFITSIYYNQQMNIIRQMLAVSIFLFSLKYIVDKKPAKFIVAILLSALIHFSAIFLLAFTPLAIPKTRHDDKKIYYTLLIVWIISLLFALGGSVVNVGSLFSGATLYQKYITNEDMIGSQAAFNLFHNFFALFYFIFYKSEKKGIYDIVFLLGCVILNLSVSFNNLLRFSYYFTPLYCAFIPTMLLQSVENKKQFAKPVLWGTSVYYIAALILSYIMNPYQLMGSEMYGFSEFFR